MNKYRILCFGDSLTWGYDPVNKVRFSDDVRWTRVLQTKLGSSFEIIEEGQNGRTIATEDPAEGEKNGLKYIGPCLESHRPLDLVIIMLGSNGCKQKFAYSAMDIAGEMQIMLEKVISFNHFRCGDSFKILLISPPRIRETLKDSWLEESFNYSHAGVSSAALAGWYKQLAEMYETYYMDASDYVITSEADGVHLDAENQKKLGDAVGEYIKNNILPNN